MKKLFSFLIYLFVSCTLIGQSSNIFINDIRGKQKPNIILLMAEDISFDLECYGMKGVKTPVLNNLASGGIKYTRCYSTNPICSPNRSAMMVGVQQSKINAQHHRGNRDLPLEEPFKPFTYWLKQAGYTTILGNSNVMDNGRKIDCNFKNTPIGKWDGKDHFGLFDQYDDYELKDQPFFAQIQLKVTHRGDWWVEVRMNSSHPVDTEDIELPSYLADHPVIRKDWATYLDQIEYMDSEVGALIKDLKTKGLYDNTVIIFVGDNGRCNLRGKGYLTESGLGVPLIINWPEGIPPGQINNDLISTLDVTATILDLAGVKVPDYVDGMSFLSEDFNRKYVYSARDRWDDVLDKSRCLTTTKFRYVRNEMPEVPYDDHQAYLEFHRPALHIMRNLDLDQMLSVEEKIFFKPIKPGEELYDIENDPEELVNLAKNPDHRLVLNRMQKLLEEAIAENKSDVDIYHPQPSIAINILEWIMYRHPDDYLRLLNGEYIEYARYVKLWRDRIEEGEE